MTIADAGESLCLQDQDAQPGIPGGMGMNDDLITTVKKALALIWRDDQCAVPPGWTTEQDGMVCHAFRSVIRDDRGTVLAEARNGAATAIVTVMNNVNALLARCEAAEAERDTWHKRFAQLESHRASLARAAQDRDISMQKRGELERELAEARVEVGRMRGGIKAWEDKEVHEAMACWKDNEQLKADMAALRQRHAQAVAVATEAIAACRCDTLHHKKSERHSAFERCPVMARLAAWLASEAKARLT